MTIKDLLLHLESDDSARPAIDFATSLAVRTGAHLRAAGIVIEYPPPTAGPSLAGAGFVSIAALEELIQENREALEDYGRKFVANAPAGVQAEFTVIQGYRGDACRDFARLARYYDLSVIGQGAPEDGRLDRRIVSETLFGSGRPVFVVPFIHKGPARLERAMICWDGGVQAARTLAAAMPLLALSRSVEVVSIGGNRERDTEPDLSIARHLARHGISVSLTALPGGEEVGDAILSYAAETGVDYIVMGAYGHWRLTEFVMGGTTRTVLASMTAPVLMAH